MECKVGDTVKFSNGLVELILSFDPALALFQTFTYRFEPDGKTSFPKVFVTEVLTPGST